MKQELEAIKLKNAELQKAFDQRREADQERSQLNKKHSTQQASPTVQESQTMSPILSIPQERDSPVIKKAETTKSQNSSHFTFQHELHQGQGKHPISLADVFKRMKLKAQDKEYSSVNDNQTLQIRKVH
jgi:hypothetical protein